MNPIEQSIKSKIERIGIPLKDWDDFFQPKVIYPNMTKYLPFYLDDGSFVTNQKCFIITGQCIAYLTAFLNSSLFKFCFRDSFPELQGGTRELSKIFFDKIPVAMVNAKTEALFKKKVSQLQNAHDQKLVTTLLQEIDQMIFEIHGINAVEQKHIGFIEII